MLSEIAFKYKTDKCPQIKHHFTEFYEQMFAGRRLEVKKVLEIGIGLMAPYYVKGASLYMWREYFPNATIYGADINPELIFADDRIITYLCDQTKRKDLRRLIKDVGSDVDIFIDDGLHTPESQIMTCLTIKPLIPNATYIIEDAGHRWIMKELPYHCQTLRHSHLKYNDDCLIIVGDKL